ncbi:transposon-encoded TnpW family protein [Streptococcus cristatus]|uniref:Uncharacterized protein n=1 Tax=Streptococcus cristatus TaxID=45634 RepID=A0A3R9MHX4_STRCR|nr:transposon-encoded TnpW family protein [Streptococcus cristatus]RSJ76831.1 hypothetical protein D8798_03220 [Streptococcus cristatus]
MEELKNTDKKGLSTKRKIGKTTYEVLVHFNENTTETMQDKLIKIMLRKLRRQLDEKKMILIKKPLTSSNRKNSKVYSNFMWCKACII